MWHSLLSSISDKSLAYQLSDDATTTIWHLLLNCFLPLKQTYMGLTVSLNNPKRKPFWYMLETPFLWPCICRQHHKENVSCLSFQAIISCLYERPPCVLLQRSLCKHCRKLNWAAKVRVTRGTWWTLVQKLQTVMFWTHGADLLLSPFLRSGGC